MPSRLECTCGRALQLKDGDAGKRVKCAGCGATIEVPLAPEAPTPDSAGALDIIDAGAEDAREYAEITKLIAQSPDEARLYVRLGDVCRRMRKTDEAIEAYRRAYALDPELTGVLHKIEAIAGPKEWERLGSQPARPESPARPFTRDRGDEADAPPPSFWRLSSQAVKYPLNSQGAAIILGGGVFFYLLKLASSFAGILAIIGYALVGGYLCAYIQQVIYSSAIGEQEPPDWPEWSDWWESVLRPALLLIGTGAFCALPAVAARIAAPYGAPPILVWVGAALGLVYFPMSLVAVSMFDSLSAVTPRLIVPAIVKLHVQYLAPCAVIGGAWWLRSEVLESAAEFLAFPGAGLIIEFLSLYLLLVVLRMLGGLYHANADKLAWM